MFYYICILYICIKIEQLNYMENIDTSLYKIPKKWHFDNYKHFSQTINLIIPIDYTEWNFEHLCGAYSR